MQPSLLDSWPSLCKTSLDMRSSDQIKVTDANANTANTQDMRLQFERKVTGTIMAFRRRRERSVAAAKQSAQTEEREVLRFNQIVESEVLPVFNKTAELLKENCEVQINRHEYTEERPFVLSVEMVISPKPDVRIRRLRQPYPKLEICLERTTSKVAIFTEYLRVAELQLEEIELSELKAEKLEQSIDSFLAEIFR